MYVAGCYFRNPDKNTRLLFAQWYLVRTAYRYADNFFRTSKHTAWAERQANCPFLSLAPARIHGSRT